MGGLVNILPFTYTMILIGSLSLMALPFLTGYYSKDVILEVAYGQFLVTGTFTYWLGTITATVTAFYSSKSLILGFFGTPNGSKKIYNSIHEAPLIMSIPLFILSFFSIFIGYLTKDFFIGIGSSGTLGTFVPTSSLCDLGIDIEFIDYSSSLSFVQFYPLFASLLGILLSFLFIKQSSTQLLLNSVVILTRFFNQRYWFDNIYNNFFLSGLLHLGGIFSRDIDRGFLSLLGPHGLQSFFISLSTRLSLSLDTGFIPHLSMIFFFSSLFFFFFI